MRNASEEVQRRSLPAFTVIFSVNGRFTPGRGVGNVSHSISMRAPMNILAPGDNSLFAPIDTAFFVDARVSLSSGRTTVPVVVVSDSTYDRLDNNETLGKGFFGGSITDNSGKLCNIWMESDGTTQWADHVNILSIEH